MTPRRAPTRDGFTLIEMIVVILIIAIMASFTLPRLVGNRDRNFELVADRIADLLTMFAQRENLSRRPIGLWEDTVNRRLALVVLDADANDPGRQSNWVVDRYVRPVTLPDDVAITDVQADGEPVDIGQWPLQTVPGQNRPAVAIVLEGPHDVITIALASHALAPKKVAGDAYHEYLGGPIDLDAAGRDREDW